MSELPSLKLFNHVSLSSGFNQAVLARVAVPKASFFAMPHTLGFAGVAAVLLILFLMVSHLVAPRADELASIEAYTDYVDPDVIAGALVLSD